MKQTKNLRLKSSKMSRDSSSKELERVSDIINMIKKQNRLSIKSEDRPNSADNPGTKFSKLTINMNNEQNASDINQFNQSSHFDRMIKSTFNVGNNSLNSKLSNIFSPACGCPSILVVDDQIINRLIL